MAKKTTGSAEPAARPTLLVSRDEAHRKLQKQIDRGWDICGWEIVNAEQFEATQRAYFNWSDFNAELLRSLFNTDYYCRQYQVGFGGIIRQKSFLEEVADLREEIKFRINHILSLQERLGGGNKDVASFPSQHIASTHRRAPEFPIAKRESYGRAV